MTIRQEIGKVRYGTVRGYSTRVQYAGKVLYETVEVENGLNWSMSHTVPMMCHVAAVIAALSAI